MFCFVSEHISNASSFSFLVLELRYYWPVVQTDKNLIVCGWNSQQIGYFRIGTVFKLSNTIPGCLWWGTEIKLNQIYVAFVHQFNLHQNCNRSIKPQPIIIMSWLVFWLKVTFSSLAFNAFPISEFLLLNQLNYIVCTSFLWIL